MHNNIRKDIINTVSNFCEINNLDYRKVWNQIYRKYGDVYKIYPHELYINDPKNRNKLDMLIMYEPLYHTLTKLQSLIKELNNV